MDGSVTSGATAVPWLWQRARDSARRLALLGAGGLALTFGELARQSEDTARRLVALGVRRGDRIALLLAPSPDFVRMVHAAQLLGATTVPLHARLGAPELAAQVAQAEVAALFCDAEHEALAAALARKLPVRLLRADGELRQVRPANAALPARMDLGAAHSIVYTSGTTGSPRGVLLTNANHLASARGSCCRLGVGREDRWLCVLPLYHVGGFAILLRSAIVGFPVVLAAPFEPRAAAAAIAKHGVTIVSLVPAMLSRMLGDAEAAAALRRVDKVLVGGGALWPSLLREALAAGVRVCATYGMTEAASQICTATPAETRRFPGSAGRPLPGVEVRIAEPNAAGWGEICLRGPQVMRGYFRNEAATSEALRGEWLHTGDVGRLDPSGRLWVRGRSGRVIVSGGEKISPEEVEEVLRAHPAVADALVYGVPDPEFGHSAVAAVARRPDSHIDAETLRQWCRERLGIKAPRQIHFVPEVPRTPTGKPCRFAFGDVVSLWGTSLWGT